MSAKASNQPFHPPEAPLHLSQPPKELLQLTQVSEA
jgi:hypothetical protein